MELDKPKKIIIGILAFLVILAIFSLVSRVKSILNYANKTPQNYTTKEQLPIKHKTSAQRYKAYDDIFKVSGPVLVYGYTPGALDDNLGTPFHEELTSMIESQNIKIEVLAYKNWKKKKIELENKYINNTQSCMMSSVVEDLEDYLKFAEKCMNGACIISSNKRRYTLITRDSEYIIYILKNMQNNN